VKSSIHRHSPIFVPHRAHRPAFVDAIFTLNYFTLRLRDVRRKCEQEVSGNAMLHSYARGRIAIVATQEGINLQA
jgi:hypothetical protein